MEAHAEYIYSLEDVKEISNYLKTHMVIKSEVVNIASTKNKLDFPNITYLNIRKQGMEIGTNNDGKSIIWNVLKNVSEKEFRAEWDQLWNPVDATKLADGVTMSEAQLVVKKYLGDAIDFDGVHARSDGKSRARTATSRNSKSTPIALPPPASKNPPASIAKAVLKAEVRDSLAKNATSVGKNKVVVAPEKSIVYNSDDEETGDDGNDDVDLSLG